MKNISYKEKIDELRTLQAIAMDQLDELTDTYKWTNKPEALQAYMRTRQDILNSVKEYDRLIASYQPLWRVLLHIPYEGDVL